MPWKEFLRPDARKITIFAILLSLIFIKPSIVVFSFSGKFLTPSEYGKLLIDVSFTTFLLVLDLVYLYFVSLLIVWIYSKLGKKLF